MTSFYGFQRGFDRVFRDLDRVLKGVGGSGRICNRSDLPALAPAASRLASGGLEAAGAFWPHDMRGGSKWGRGF